MVKNNFSTKFIDLLKEKNMTQKELCKVLDIQESVVSRWMRGKAEPMTKSIGKIAKFFDVPVGYFYDKSNYNNIHNSNIGNNNTINNNNSRLELIEEKIKRLELEIELLKRGKK